MRLSDSWFIKAAMLILSVGTQNPGRRTPIDHIARAQIFAKLARVEIFGDGVGRGVRECSSFDISGRKWVKFGCFPSPDGGEGVPPRPMGAACRRPIGDFRLFPAWVRATVTPQRLIPEIGRSFIYITRALMRSGFVENEGSTALSMADFCFWIFLQTATYVLGLAAWVVGGAFRGEGI